MDFGSELGIPGSKKFSRLFQVRKRKLFFQKNGDLKNDAFIDKQYALAVKITLHSKWCWPLYYWCVIDIYYRSLSDAFPGSTRADSGALFLFYLLPRGRSYSCSVLYRLLIVKYTLHYHVYCILPIVLRVAYQSRNLFPRVLQYLLLAKLKLIQSILVYCFWSF